MQESTYDSWIEMLLQLCKSCALKNMSLAADICFAVQDIVEYKHTQYDLSVMQFAFIVQIVVIFFGGSNINE